MRWNVTFSICGAGSSRQAACNFETAHCHAGCKRHTILKLS
jgi:hypothetical protein